MLLSFLILNPLADPGSPTLSQFKTSSARTTNCSVFDLNLFCLARRVFSLDRILLRYCKLLRTFHCSATTTIVFVGSGCYVLQSHRQIYIFCSIMLV